MPMSAESRTELSRQIEALESNAVRLEVHGFNYETAATLAEFIRSGAPDLVALKEHGIPLDTAISICQEISQRHARLKPLPALPYPEPDPLPPAEPVATATEADIEREYALSLLHDLSEQIAANRGDQTVLHRAGFSKGAAREIAHIINCSRGTR